jgi:hypothetical protein
MEFLFDEEKTSTSHWLTSALFEDDKITKQHSFRLIITIRGTKGMWNFRHPISDCDICHIVISLKLSKEGDSARTNLASPSQTCQIVHFSY